MNVTSSVNDIDEVTKQIKVSIPLDTIANEFESAISQLSRTTKIKGFRPGKAPRTLVEKLHGGRVRIEVKQKLISNSLYDLVREHKIDMIGNPNIDVGSLDEDKELEYTASISIYPKPEIKGYDKFKVSVGKKSVSDEKVQESIERLRQTKAKVNTLERTDAKKGDIITGELTVEVEGEQASRSEPVFANLGDKSLPAELEAAIEGQNKEETRSVMLTVPDDYPHRDLRGKQANYKFTLKALYERVLPELTDEFAKSLEMQVETVDELKKNLSEKLEKDFERESKADAQAAILDQLLAQNEFKVPQLLVDDEMRQLIMRSGLVDASKISPEQIPLEPFRGKLEEVAKKRVRTAVIVDRIAQQESVKVAEEDIEKAIGEIAESNAISREEVASYFKDRQRIQSFVVEIARNKVLEMLSSRAEIEYTEKKEEPKKG